MLTRLRESGEAALFVSCGEIVNIGFKDGGLVIQTDKRYLAELIDTEQNILTLKRALRYLGYNFDIKVEEIEGKNEMMERDIEFLKGKLGNYLKIE